MMDFPSSSSVFLIDGEQDEDQMQYFHLSRTFSTQPSTSYEIPHRTEKKRKFSNHQMPMPMPMNFGPKRLRSYPYEPQGRTSTSQSVQSGTEFEPILLDPDDYVIEEPETHSFRAFDWTIDHRQHPSAAPVSKAPAPPPMTLIEPRTPINLMRNDIRRPSPLAPQLDPTSTQQSSASSRKGLPLPVTMPPTTTSLPLPLPKPTATLPRTPAKRGRPTKTSRPGHSFEPSPATPIHRPSAEAPVISSTPRPSAPGPSSSVYPTHSEIRRQTLNGTGIFSAFHDSKYYRCNICKFKSVTSSTLLQHLFTHLFFCHQCSFYTFSHHQLAQHLFDKHQLNFIEDTSSPSNPSSFDLLYLTRCADGTFALCMDASAPNNAEPSSSAATTASPSSSSSISFLKSVPTKKRKIPIENGEDTVISLRKDSSTESVAPKPMEIVEKPVKRLFLMKTRGCFTFRRPMCLHALTLEYRICRNAAIKEKFPSTSQSERKCSRSNDQPRRLIEEIAHCIRTVVNEIVAKEENSPHSSPFSPLPESVLDSIFQTENLQTLTEAVKLVPKSKKFMTKKTDHSKDSNEQNIFVLGLTDANLDETAILSLIHSNWTNGESVHTQSPLPKLPPIYDNTARFLRVNSATRLRVEPKKPPTKTKPPSPSKPPLTNTVISNSTVPATRVDRNNNPIGTSARAKESATDSSCVIILD